MFTGKRRGFKSLQAPDFNNKHKNRGSVDTHIFKYQGQFKESELLFLLESQRVTVSTYNSSTTCLEAEYTARISFVVHIRVFVTFFRLDTGIALGSTQRACDRDHCNWQIDKFSARIFDREHSEQMWPLLLRSCLFNYSDDRSILGVLSHPLSTEDRKFVLTGPYLHSIMTGANAKGPSAPRYCQKTTLQTPHRVTNLYPLSAVWSRYRSQAHIDIVIPSSLRSYIRPFLK